MLREFCSRVGFDPECTEVLLSAVEALGSALEKAVERYLADERLKAIDAVAALPAEEVGIADKTRDAAFVLLAFFRERDAFLRDCGEEVYYDTARDLVWKTRECKMRYGYYGTAAITWHNLLLRRTLFALGRLQFHTVPFYPEIYVGKRRTVMHGDPVIKVHIPSSGRITEEECLESYRRAYRFFRDRFDTDEIPFICFSWLLDPELSERMPEGGIAAFAAPYRIFDCKDDPESLDLWRVFGHLADGDKSSLPRDNRLRAILADRIESGGCMRSGYGIFLHNGEKPIEC